MVLNPAQHQQNPQQAMLPHLGPHSPQQLPALHEGFDHNPLNAAVQEDAPPQGMGLPVVMYGPHMGPAAAAAAALQPNNNPAAGEDVPAGQAHQGPPRPKPCRAP